MHHAPHFEHSKQFAQAGPMNLTAKLVNQENSGALTHFVAQLASQKPPWTQLENSNIKWTVLQYICCTLDAHTCCSSTKSPAPFT